MGYTITFHSAFVLDRELDDDTFTFLKKLNDTRRMKRAVGPEYGVEGEFYVDGGGMCGQAEESNIVDYNTPPSTQPGLWCQWVPTEDRRYIQWDGGEKFYNYVKWLQYIIDKILQPEGYVLNGQVAWVGEDSSDQGIMVVKDNKITTLEKTYER